jgi:hypothetical protein
MKKKEILSKSYILYGRYQLHHIQTFVVVIRQRVQIVDINRILLVLAQLENLCGHAGCHLHRWHFARRCVLIVVASMKISRIFYHRRHRVFLENVDLSLPPFFIDFALTAVADLFSITRNFL